MVEYFLRFIKDNHLLQKEEKTLLAVSGGVDSMVLSHLFKEAGMKFGVAHVNYQLRGGASNKDEALVRRWCHKNDIEYFSTTVSEGTFDGKDSVQMAARDFRYNYFNRLINEHGYHKIAIAHHLDDSLETVLLNLTKGTGLRGLTGISSLHGAVIRPLLFATKEEIVAYARTNEIEWREDASNEKNDYQRNVIRNKVVPILKEINPGLLTTFSRSLERLNDASQLLSSLAAKITTDHLAEQGGHYQLGLGWMNNLQGHRSLLSEVLRPFGFSDFQVKDILVNIREGIPGKMFYSSGYALNTDRNQLLIRKQEDLPGVSVGLMIPGTTRVKAIAFHTRVEDGNALPENATDSIAYLDYNKLIGGEPRIRKWEEGDYFYPLGMKGKKKISDFMIDSKIPLSLKRDVLILECGGDIAWVVGWRIDDRFKITEGTTRVLIIETQ